MSGIYIQVLALSNASELQMGNFIRVVSKSKKRIKCRVYNGQCYHTNMAPNINIEREKERN